jgi:hypothetical protein
MFIKRFVGTGLAVAFASTTASAQPYINSIFINPPGTDAPKEIVELRGPASGTIPANTYLVFVEGDSASNPGDVQNIFSLGGLSYGSNGLLYLRQGSSTYAAVDANTNVITGAGAGWTGVAGFLADSGSDIENPSATVFIINTATAPTVTDDIDSNDDSTPDGSVYSGWTVLDSVAFLDGGVTDIGYGQICFRVNGAGFAGIAATVVGLASGFDPEFFGRRGTSTGFASTDWFVADVTENAGPTMTVNAGEGFPAGIVGLDILTTFGGSNASLPVSISEFSAE